VLLDWLRAVEEHLAVEIDWWESWSGPAASALLAALPEFVDRYLDLGDQARTDARLTFGRFRRVCHKVSDFAAMQIKQIDGPNAIDGLRRGFAALALVGDYTDYRDELTFLWGTLPQTVARGLPVQAELDRAVACASAQTAQWLRRATEVH
jgi:hypothetical protein